MMNGYSLIFFVHCLIISFRGVPAQERHTTIQASVTDVTAGDDIIFKLVTTDDKVATCSLTPDLTLSTADNNDFLITIDNGRGQNLNIKSFNIGPGTSKSAVAILQAARDNDPIDETLSVTLSCFSTAGNYPDNDEKFTIKPLITTVGDPHFLQIIRDKDLKRNRLICYDVVGKSGEIIHIFSHSKLQLKVTGVLMDDYYMHKILVQFRNTRFEFTTNEILKNLTRMYDWNEVKNKMWTRSNGFLIQRNDNYLQIGDSFGTDISVAIYRRSKPTGEMYLDVSILGLNNDYSGQDGLIGRIGNNEFRFYDSVQGDELNDRIGVEINRKLFKGRQEKETGRRCLLINVEDALYPYKLTDYVK